MALSRKHYEVIASIIKDNSEIKTFVDLDNCNLTKETIIDKESFINDLTMYFKSDNSAFSWERFVNACDDV